MKIEALTEHYQTRRKTALNRVQVEPEKFARLPPGRASRKTLIACIQTLSPTTATNCHARRSRILIHPKSITAERFPMVRETAGMLGETVAVKRRREGVS
jgi:hypothetical protein